MSKLIKVMISSRCNDPIVFSGRNQPLSEVRKQVKLGIESQEIFGAKAFECWINEDAPALPGDVNAWDHCMNKVKEANIVIAFYNGKAGWCKDDGGIGICHAELVTALGSGAAKLRLIELPIVKDMSKLKADSPDKRFHDYIAAQELFIQTASTGEEIITEVKKALSDAVIDMVQRGKLEASKGKYDSGQALDWSRLNYGQRKAEIERVISDSIGGVAPKYGLPAAKTIDVMGRKLLVKCHGVPAAMSVAAARELVGRPFLKDHELDDLLEEDVYGPVHIIGCHKKITEHQATGILGFPDAIVVSTSFGVYVADNVQKVQLIFLADCRDEASTRHAVQRFRSWIQSTGEVRYLVDRAGSRRKIVKAIAGEYAGVMHAGETKTKGFSAESVPARSRPEIKRGKKTTT